MEHAFAGCEEAARQPMLKVKLVNLEEAVVVEHLLDCSDSLESRSD